MFIFQVHCWEIKLCCASLHFHYLYLRPVTDAWYVVLPNKAAAVNKEQQQHDRLCFTAETAKTEVHLLGLQKLLHSSI